MERTESSLKSSVDCSCLDQNCHRQAFLTVHEDDYGDRHCGTQSMLALHSSSPSRGRLCVLWAARKRQSRPGLWTRGKGTNFKHCCYFCRAQVPFDSLHPCSVLCTKELLTKYLTYNYYHDFSFSLFSPTKIRFWLSFGIPHLSGTSPR